MYKIDKILIGTHNKGKFKEISDLLPKAIKKISPNELNMESPEESGKNFLQNSEIKADFFCKKSHLSPKNVTLGCCFCGVCFGTI